MKKYDTYNHAKAHIRYHFIFSTKYRKRCLCGIEEEVGKVMCDIASHGDFRIVAIGIDGDHLHMVVRSAPSVAPYQIVRRLKQVSTRRLWQSHEGHLRRFYWGRKRVLWSNGYFCSTVGEVCESKVLEYVNNQG